MRISTSYQYDTYSNRVRTAQQNYVDAQRKVMTGKKFETVSDDPISASLVINSSALKGAFNQYNKNLSTTKTWLSFSENGLSNSKDAVKQSYTLAVQAANSTVDQTARNSMATQIADLQSRLLNEANSQAANGEYLFAGQKTNVKPFTVSAGVITYNGDGLNRIAETSPGNTMVMNTQGQQLFTNAYNALESLRQNLIGGNISAISGVDIQNLQNSMDALTSATATVGTKLNTIQNLTDQNQRRIDDFTTKISDLQEVDMSEAITKYKSAETAYSAAMQVASKGFSLSLMDFIR